MQIEVGDLVKLHREFRHTNPIEGSPYWATGLGIVVRAKERNTPPITNVKEYTVFWHASQECTINAYASLVKVSEKREQK
jgi:hypothetical protein